MNKQIVVLLQAEPVKNPFEVLAQVYFKKTTVRDMKFQQIKYFRPS